MTPQNQSTTAQKLKEIRERLEKATPGPWKAVSDLPRYAVINMEKTEGGTWIKRIVVPSENHHAYFTDEEKGCHQSDAEFIANAPSDISALLTLCEIYEKAFESCIYYSKRMDGHKSIVEDEIEKAKAEAEKVWGKS